MVRMRICRAINIKPVFDNTTASQTRLLQLVSSGLPIGSFTYSQGLEWAVEAGWLQSESDLQAWLNDILQSSMTYLEMPLFGRLQAAYAKQDFALAGQWLDYLLASRETAELKMEEQQRGRAFARLLPALGLPLDDNIEQQLQQAQLAGFAYAVAQWEIEPVSAIRAYGWSWLENLTLAGVKLIPLGQTAGQKILLALGDNIALAVSNGLALDDEDIGFSCCAQAIASSLHESQYTRLYRS